MTRLLANSNRAVMRNYELRIKNYTLKITNREFMNYAVVVVEAPLTQLYHYLIPETLRDKVQVGSRVVAPFGGRKIRGFCVAITAQCPIDPARCKAIISVGCESEIIFPELLKLTEWAANYYHCGWGVMLAAAVPMAVRKNKNAASKKASKKVAAECLALPPSPKKIQLNNEQTVAVAALITALDKNVYAPFLLHGITGSGKTEIYLQAMINALNAGKSVLVLVPEISLTPQTVGRFAARAQGEVLTLHSNMTAAQRASAWRRLRTGEVRVVVGARSAVFAPLNNLGLIIVDEEHEHTFKQENEPRYHARDLAVLRATLANAVIVLGSATPSLESWRNADGGKYQLLTLRERPGGAQMARTQIVNMAEEFREQKKVVTFSRVLVKEITACLARREQAILFLNRRGFNTEVRCKSCGEPLYCEHCTIALTYHRRDGIMRCHYCAYTLKPPTRCPQCASPALQFFGTGTERVEKILAELFPSARLLRMDSDTMRGADAHGKALTAFANGEYDILLGTQMVTKGFDFPNVTLVGVLAGDSAINLPDFRAAEKTFQLITQVVGRAGRAEKAGVAIIQAFNPEHYAVQFALQQNFADFAAHELNVREPLGYPPFGRLARIIARGKNEIEVKKTLAEIATLLRQHSPKNGKILGPAPCIVEKLQGDYRYHLLLKTTTPRALKNWLTTINEFFAIRNERLRLAVDIDPLSMM